MIDKGAPLIDEASWNEKLVEISEYRNLSESPRDTFQKIQGYLTKNPNELVEVAEQNLENAKLIVQTPSLVNRFTSKNLTSLMLAHKELVSLILYNISLANKIRDFDLAKLGCAHLEAALIIMKSPVLYEKCFVGTFQEIAEKHPDVVKLMLTTPAIAKRLFGDIVHDIGLKSVENAQLIIQHKECTQTLSAYNLLTLARKHPSIAIDILKNPTLLARLDNDFLELFGKISSDVAVFILTSKKLIKRCYLSQLCNIGTEHDETIMYILKHSLAPLINDKDFLMTSSTAHLDAARYILQIPALYNQLDEDTLGYIGENWLEIAKIILNTKEIAKRCTPVTLCRIGCSHVETAYLVLNNPELVKPDNFFGYYKNSWKLEELASKNAEIAMTIIKNDTLRSICEPFVGSIANYHLITAQYILENLPQYLDKYHLRHMSRTYPECAIIISKTPRLRQLSGLEFLTNDTNNTTKIEVKQNSKPSNFAMCRFGLFAATTVVGLVGVGVTMYQQCKPSL